MGELVFYDHDRDGGLYPSRLQECRPRRGSCAALGPKRGPVGARGLQCWPGVRGTLPAKGMMGGETGAFILLRLGQQKAW